MILLCKSSNLSIKMSIHFYNNHLKMWPDKNIDIIWI